MSSRRRTTLVALLLTVLGLQLSVPSAIAADDEPSVAVTIQTLDPTGLSPGDAVTMTGTVTNSDDHAWTKVQAYLVIPASPFTTRGQVEDTIGTPGAYTGTRVVETGSFDEVGDLAPGQALPFQVTVPYEQLRITGAQGVYPVGVQILATDDEGNRSQTAIARATTFLPSIAATQQSVPTSVVWPFLMPDHRTTSRDYADPAALVEAVSAGGRLRSLLDLASSTPAGSATVVVDPALLVGVDDLAKGRHQPDDVDTTDAQRAAASLFLQDLLSFARARSAWILDYDRPDVLALSDNPDLAPALKEAIAAATADVLTTFQLSGRRVAWPTRDGVSRDLLVNLRGNGDSPVIVRPNSVPEWEARLGSLIQYDTPGGPVPLLVDDFRDGAAPGSDTVATLRQRILTEASVAVLERAIDPRSRADAVIVVDPDWDPGANWAAGDLASAFTVPYVQATSLDSVLSGGDLATYDGDVPARAKARPLSRQLLEQASAIVSAGRTLSSIIAQDDPLAATLARDVAEVLAVHWRQDRSEALSIASKRARRTGGELRKISIEAPPSVTLSSSKGGFPLTIRNDSDQAIRIGVDLDSSNPALSIPSVDQVEVGAGERRTLTVQIDLGTQRTTFLTARLMSVAGESFGGAQTFKVRSSSISTVLWVAMGLAGAFVLFALVRRFHRRRTGTASEQLADDDD